MTNPAQRPVAGVWFDRPAGGATVGPPFGSGPGAGVAGTENHAPPGPARYYNRALPHPIRRRPAVPNPRGVVSPRATGEIRPGPRPS